MTGLRQLLVLLVITLSLQGCGHKPLAQARVLEIWESGRPAAVFGYTKGSMLVYRQTTLFTDSTFETRQTIAAGMGQTTTQLVGEWSTDPQSGERVLIAEGKVVDRLQPPSPDEPIEANPMWLPPPQRVYAVPEPNVRDTPFPATPRLSE